MTRLPDHSNRRWYRPVIASLLVALLASWTGFARGDVALLVHGWSSGPDQWLLSGVIAELASDGWQDQGVLVAGAGGLTRLPPHYLPIHLDQGRTIYRSLLPDRAPLQLQADQLAMMVQSITRHHPDEPITLVGHSIGGVVARLALVTRPQMLLPATRRLITIASPHHGTALAGEALDAGFNRPFFCPGPGFDTMRNLFGGNDLAYIRNSRAALGGVLPALPGTLLGWLNQQPHPAIDYHTIVRVGDPVVPPASQRLPAVVPSATLVAEYPSPAGHRLSPFDGRLIAQLLLDATSSVTTVSPGL